MPALNYTASSTNWVAHSTWCIVELWGGGASGGGCTAVNPRYGGGGAGGCYVEHLTSGLTLGSNYAVAVGQTKAGVSASAGAAGNDSTFNATTAVAKGGLNGGALDAADAAGGGAGGSTGCTGNITVSGGGNGGNRAGTSSGGGGGSGGSAGAGGNASGITKGEGTAIRPADGSTTDGDGAAGRSSSGAGTAGTAYGGGGGGGRTTSAAARAGGSGAAGYGRVYWSPPSSLLLLGCG